MAKWGTTWTDYAEAVVNPAGSTFHIAQDISQSVAEARAAQAEAKAAAAEADARAKAAAAEARAAQAEAGARAAEAERLAAESRKATPKSGGDRSRTTTIRSPAGVTFGKVGQAAGATTSPTVWLVAGAVVIIGGIYYYQRKKR